ncbi:MAG: hypothetical protein DHS20C15_14030 [Planctomycetota bacterium]|nr:MAG: hypothetical protein DHS20C15_14030 [Planctomycetota bacterium]
MLDWLVCRFAPTLPALTDLPPGDPPDPLGQDALLERTREAHAAARAAPFEPHGETNPLRVLLGMGCRDLVNREADQHPDTAGRSRSFEELGPWSPVQLRVQDGPLLTGHHSLGAPGAPVVIVEHGMFDSHTAAYVVEWAECLRRWGFHVFAFDLRDHGQLLEGEHTATLGIAEGRDLFRAARTLGRAEGVSVGLLGLSYGGQCVVRAAHEATLAGETKVLAGGVVSVCGPLDIGEALATLDDPRRLPRLPGFVDRQILNGLFKVTRRQLAARLRQRGVRPEPRAIYASFVRDVVLPNAPSGLPDKVDAYLDAARSTSSEVLGALAVPTLLLHSSDDPFVSVSHLHSALAAAGDNPWVAGRELPAGGHVGLAPVDPEGARNLIAGFFARLRSG